MVSGDVFVNRLSKPSILVDLSKFIIPYNNEFRRHMGFTKDPWVYFMGEVLIGYILNVDVNVDNPDRNIGIGELLEQFSENIEMCLNDHVKDTRGPEYSVSFLDNDNMDVELLYNYAFGLGNSVAEYIYDSIIHAVPRIYVNGFYVTPVNGMKYCYILKGF